LFEYKEFLSMPEQLRTTRQFVGRDDLLVVQYMIGLQPAAALILSANAPDAIRFDRKRDTATI
jgi:hypothetical protein